jgi:hypothetical protein
VAFLFSTIGAFIAIVRLYIMKPIYFLLFLFSISIVTSAQDIPIEGQKRIYFPHPMDDKWRMSVGITSTTMPSEITEELRFRIPSVDLHAIKKVTNKFYLDGRILAQGFQNFISVGPRWATPITERISMSLGNDFGYWFGALNLENIKTKGSGFQNYPSISMGYRFNKSILLTLRAESIMNFGIKTFAGKTDVTTDYRLFSGSAYSIILEQPFVGKKSMTLGLRAIYSDYYWQTWTLFESFDRNLFFPQLIVGLIL